MSRIYRLSLSDSASEHVVIEDGVCARLELLDVLPRPEMEALLAQELARRGFQTKDGAPSSFLKREGDVELTVDLAEGTVSVRLAQEADVKVTRNIEVAADTDDLRAEARVRSRLDDELKRGLKDETERLRTSVTARLEKVLPDLKREVDQATNRVVAEALKIKAAQLGEIESIHEEPDGSITIKVRT